MGIDFKGIRGIGGIKHAAPKDQGAAGTSSIRWKDLSFKINPPKSGKWEKIVPVKEEGNTLTIQIRSTLIPGEVLDKGETQVIGYELFHLADELKKPANHRDGKPPVLRLDFSNITYFSSIALGKLITLNKKQNENGSTFELDGIGPELYEVFEITTLNKIFTIKNPPAPTPKP